MSRDDLPTVRTQPGPDIHDAGDVERLDRFQPLNPGHYWRAKASVKDEEIPKDCVLLLQRIKRVDDVPHAVEMAGHPLLNPNGNHTFLVQDFLNRFEPEPRGASIRAQEMGELQASIAQQQRDLLTFQTDPAALLEAVRQNPALPAPEDRKRADRDLPVAAFDFSAGLPSADFRPSSSIVDLAAGDSALMQRQAENGAIIARKRAEMISAKTEAIAETVRQMTPFFEEMGAVALAQSSDALDIYKKLKTGLATLGLYTGKDVTVTKVRDGEPAPAEEVIHILQALMYMDEESAINIVEGGENISDLARFRKQLAKHDDLLHRLIPVQRGIVAMRYKHERRDHAEGTDPWTMARIDDEDMKCFLIIRNGERVNIVHSSLEKMDRMFPTQSDFDQPFTVSGFWRGVESERITVDDVQFSDARSKLDNLVLHYRRVLILLAGLYDRDRHVIGDIPVLGGKSGLGMLSLSVQETVFRAVSDEERALGTGRPDFFKWMEERNSLAQSGSRLLCNWHDLMTADSAPGAVRRGDRYDYNRYEPKEPHGLAIAYRSGQSIEVECPVMGKKRGRHNYGEEREFNASVNVTAWEKHGGTRGEFGYLCLDDVTPEDINYYIYTRHQRRSYIKYVPLLLAARTQLEFDAKREEQLRADLRRTSAPDSAISTAIRHWRAARRGAPAPTPADETYGRDVKSLGAQLKILADEGTNRKSLMEQTAIAEGRKPLRLALYGRGRFHLYATARADEREELLGAHPWVVRLSIERSAVAKADRFTVTDRRHVILPKLDAREEVLEEWAGVEEWVEPAKFHSLSYDQARGLRDLGAETLTRSAWLAPKNDAAFDAMLSLCREYTRTASGRSVVHGYLFLPLVIVRVTKNETMWYGSVTGNRTTTYQKFYVGGLSVEGVDALYSSGTTKQRDKMRDWFRNQYRNPTHAISNLGAAPRFTYLSLNSFAAEKNRTLDSFTGHWVSDAPKKRDAGADEKALLKHLVESEGRSDKATADVILRFEDAAVSVYQAMGARK